MVLNLWVLGAAALGLHRISAWYGLSPILFFLGGTAAILQYTSLPNIYIQPLPWLVVFLGSNILVPVMLMSVLVLYVMNGTSAARQAIAGILGVSVLTILVLAMFRTNMALHGGGNLANIPVESPIFTPRLAVLLASNLAFLADLYVIAITYQGLKNAGAPVWLASGLALLASLFTDAVLFQVLSAPDVATLAARLPGALVGKSISALLLWPLAEYYLRCVTPKLPFQNAKISNRRALDLLLGTYSQMEAALVLSEALQHRRAEELAALQATLMDITASDLTTSLHLIVERAARLLDAPSGGLYLCEPEREEVRCVVSFNTPSDHRGIVLKYGEGAAGMVAQTGQPLIIPDYARWEHRAITYEEGRPFASVLSAPIQWKGQVTGVLHLLREARARPFTENELELLTAFANQAAITLENARLLENERKQVERAETLREVASALNSTLDLERVLNLILEQLARVIGYESASVMLLSENRLAFATHRGLHSPTQETIPLEMGSLPHMQEVIQERRPVIIPDTLADPGWLTLPEADYIRCWLGVPLVVKDQVIGLLNLDMNIPGYYTSQDADLALAFAHQAATAIENARLFAESQRRARELSGLYETALATSSVLETRALLDRLFEQVTRLMHPDSFGVFLHHPETGELEVIYAIDDAQPLEEMLGMRISLEEGGFSGYVMRTRQPFLTRDVLRDELPTRPRHLTRPARTWLGVPLITHDRLIGVMSVQSFQPNAFDKGDRRLMEALAAQVAASLENARLYQDAERRAYEAETLREVGSVVAASLQQQEAIERILEQLARVVPYDSASVQLLQEGKYLEIVGGRGWPDLRAVLGQRFAIPGDNPNSEVVKTKQPLILDNAPKKYSPFREQVHSHIKSWLGVPLIVQDQVIGMLAVDKSEPAFFNAEHARLVTAFADQVAIAIENARLYEAQRQRVDELEALRATLAELSMELELPKLLLAILERAISLLKVTGGDLGLYHEETREIAIVVSLNLDKDYTGVRLKIGEGAMGYAAELGEAVIIRDYSTWANRSAQYTEGPWHAAMAAPLMIGGRLVGALSIVDSDKQREFTASDLRVLTLFAYQAAIAMENARLFQLTREASERRAVLHRASQEIVSSSLVPEQIYAAIHKAAAQLMPCEAFTIVLYDEARQEVEGVYLVDRGGRSPVARMRVEGGLSGYIIQTGKPLLLTDAKEAQNFPIAHFGQPEHIQSLLAIPLRLGGKVIGILSTQSYTPHTYTYDDQELLELLGGHAAIALENARLFQKVQTLAITDGLTGLANRRAFDHTLENEMARALRYGHPLSLVMLDIDNFKIYNDTYGHPAGDERLKAIAHLLTQCVRAPDVAARYGGEEFTLVLPHTNKEGGIKLAERIRAEAAEAAPTLPPYGQPVPGYTICLGVASFPEDGATPAELLRAADDAELAAKRAGKNRVCVAGKTEFQRKEHYR